MKTLYTARAKSVGGREGRVETDDRQLSFDCATPGSGKSGTNPEQLFACGYAACFGSALAHVAQKRSVDTGPITVQSRVNLNQDDKGFQLDVALDVSLPKLQKDEAEKLVMEAHRICPYSKATQGNIKVELKVNNQAMKKAA